MSNLQEAQGQTLSVASSAPPSRKLVVGCGVHRLPGWLHADLTPTGAADLAFDLVQPWPLADNSMTTVLASHVLEHLHDFRAFFREAWRVLAPDGQLYLRVPYGLHPAAHWDPTHVTYWVTEKFCFLQPGYGRQIGNPQNEGWDAPFRVEMIDQRLSRQVTRVLRWKWVRTSLLPWVEHVQNAIEELFISARPLKTREAVQQFAVLNPGTHLPYQYVAWRHHVERRDLRAGEDPQLVVLGVGITANGYL